MKTIKNEWLKLIEYFGEDYTNKMFNNFMSYKELRNKHSYKQILDELIKLDN